MGEEVKGKRFLVTGAGGFIGSHLVERLVGQGAKVRAFVRYNSRNDWGYLELLPKNVLREVEVVAGDLRDSYALYSAARNVDIICHLGALIAIPYSYIHPREVIETNVMGTLNMLMAARELGTGRVIHASTSEVYGTARYVPIDESHPLHGQSPYSAGKIGADKIAESFHLSFGLPVAIIRPFNTYGPRQSARAVIPTIITQALAGEKIFLGSLHPRRDFTYVDDTVAAFVRAAESAEAVGSVINIGSNFEVSVGDIAQKIVNIAGRHSEIVVDPQRFRPAGSEVERLWCDNTKARELLGWEPKVSLDEGLRRAIEWFSRNMNLYKAELYNL